MPPPKPRPSSCRSVTVGRIFQRRGARHLMVPMIRLRGRWLEEAGFSVGDAVDVIVDGNELRLVCRRSVEAKAIRQGQLF